MAHTYVIGDIHGANKALIQCLDGVNFNYQKDTLICLGDVCDGWPEVYNAIEELLKIDNLIYILGNHDEWALEWFKTGEVRDIWINQGGKATIESYTKSVPAEHISFMENAKLFYKLENKVFVHGGLKTDVEVEKQGKEILIWDRSLLQNALEYYFEENEKRLTRYDEVFIGHTPSINFGIKEPKKVCEVYLMDTGAGWPGGKLSIMDVYSKQVFQSNEVSSLYPGYKGRGW